MADIVKTLTSNLKLVAVAVGAVALFGGTATTISLADNSTPTPGGPTTKPAPQPNPKATEKKTEKAETEDADDKDEPNGVRPTDTHGYCVSHAVAAAKAAGKTGQDIAAAAHSCKKDKKHGKSATAPGHTK